ncbi:MAG: MFS transporter [Clostridia bacterium]|nr:MFS transporter [Clostridia bacterium]
MEKSKKLTPSLLFNIILFGFMGQVAWAVENNFFNMYLYNRIGGTEYDIANMVAASAATAMLSSLFMGSLSDKLNRRKIFISAGYIVWGITVMSFAFITPENVAKVTGSPVVAAIPATVMLVIIMDCVMTFMGSTSNDAAFNAWVTDVTNPSNRTITETILAACPVVALVVVTAAFGSLSSVFGYGPCFIGLGLLVTVCGVIGIFTIKDSRNGVKTSASFIECLTYGFRPSVIKNNKSLYIALVCMGIFSIASQVFFPYLFIYIQHYINMDTLTSTPIYIIIPCVLALIGVVVLLVKLFTLIDKVGKAKIAFPCSAIFVVGLALVFFAGKNFWFFAVTILLALAGYALLMILLNAAIRDFTPEDKAGQLQGIRMIFSVLLPMVIGPRVAAGVINHFAVDTYINEYQNAVNIPVPHIYLTAAIIAVTIFIPLIFLAREFKKEKTA